MTGIAAISRLPKVAIVTPAMHADLLEEMETLSDQLNKTREKLWKIEDEFKQSKSASSAVITKLKRVVEEAVEDQATIKKLRETVAKQEGEAEKFRDALERNKRMFHKSQQMASEYKKLALNFETEKNAQVEENMKLRSALDNMSEYITETRQEVESGKQAIQKLSRDNNDLRRSLAHAQQGQNENFIMQTLGGFLPFAEEKNLRGDQANPHRDLENITANPNNRQFFNSAEGGKLLDKLASMQRDCEEERAKRQIAETDVETLQHILEATEFVKPTQAQKKIIRQRKKIDDLERQLRSFEDGDGRETVIDKIAGAMDTVLFNNLGQGISCNPDAKSQQRAYPVVYGKARNNHFVQSYINRCNTGDGCSVNTSKTATSGTSKSSTSGTSKSATSGTSKSATSGTSKSATSWKQTSYAE